MAITLLFWSVSIACWGYALWYGGAEARCAFFFFLLQSAGSAWATWPSSSDFMTGWHDLNVTLFVSDSLFFLGLYGLALCSRKHWPIWIAGVQLCCVVTHFGPLIDPDANAKLYRALETMWAIPIYAFLVVGVARDHRWSLEQEALGHDRACLFGRASRDRRSPE